MGKSTGVDNGAERCLTELFSIFGLPSYVHSDRGSSFMSEDVKQFFMRHGIATSRTTPYNPRGNSQCERYNGIIWKTVVLALEDRGLSINAWPQVLPDALHAIRSLLCTATNATPHERMFAYERRTASGCALPSWLLEPGEVLLKTHGSKSKYEPPVEVVELIEANPSYAHIRFLDGREDTVSLRNLAPCPRNTNAIPETNGSQNDASVTEGSDVGDSVIESVCNDGGQGDETTEEDSSGLRRSSRTRKPVDRLIYE